MFVLSFQGLVESKGGHLNIASEIQSSPFDTLNYPTIGQSRLFEHSDSFWRIIEWAALIIRREGLLSIYWLLFSSSNWGLQIYLKLDYFLVVLNLLSLILGANVDHFWVSLKIVLIIKSGFPSVTISAKWHIHISTSNHSLNALIRSSESKRRVLLAKLANRG